MLKCSHILCKVTNLPEVVRHYESLGFSMEWGSAPEKACNALLWFEEGPFIEFFQIPKVFEYVGVPLGLVYGQAARRRWFHWAAAPEGWCDVAMEPAEEAEENTARAFGQLRAAVVEAGISTSRVIKGKRTRRDGSKVRYRFFAPDPVGLPFVVSAYDPPQRPERVVHPNGATCVAYVNVGVSEKHRSAFETLSKGDTRIKIKPSPQTRVVEVGLSGLSSPLDHTQLHGAVFEAAE